MKITKEQLNSIGFNNTVNNPQEFLFEFDYLYNINTRNLYYTDDGAMEELIAKIDSFEHLKQVMLALGYDL